MRVLWDLNCLRNKVLKKFLVAVLIRWTQKMDKLAILKMENVIAEPKRFYLFQCMVGKFDNTKTSPWKISPEKVPTDKSSRGKSSPEKSATKIYAKWDPGIYNCGHNILECYSVLVQFRYSISQMELYIYYNKVCIWVATWVTERLRLFPVQFYSNSILSSKYWVRL